MGLNDMFDKLGNFVQKNGETIKNVVTVVGAVALTAETWSLHQDLDQIKQNFGDLENEPGIEAVSQLSVEETAEYTKDVNQALEDYFDAVEENGVDDHWEEKMKEEFADLIEGLDITDGDYVKIDPKDINDAGDGRVR